MSGEFEGKTALVTGGAKGIGRACVEALAANGANVAINYRTSESAARALCQRIVTSGVRACAVQADVSDESQVGEMVSAAEQQIGPIDLLVNNAGVFDVVDHERTTPAVWHRALDQNLTSAYLVTWAVKPGMIQRGFGRIVNVASIAGLRARPTCIAYSVSKAGLIAMTKSLSEAIAPHNIRVNAVAPGLIDTEMVSDVDGEVRQKIIDATPLRRLGKPAEIAELVTFLLSERSSFITGQTVVASGGRVLLP